MKVYLALLVAVVALASAHDHEKRTPEERACHDVLKPEKDKELIDTYVTDCIAEQSGLQAIIDELKPADGTRERGPGNRGRGGRHHIAESLEGAGFTIEASKLRICIAQKKGYVTGGAFDVAAFKSSLQQRVAGTPQEANTKIGLDNCPTAPLTERYNFSEYMKCIKSTCATGQVPAPQ